MKLSKAQQRVLDEAKHNIAVLSKYKNFVDFFDNSAYEQSYICTAAKCNAAWNSSKRWMEDAADEWSEMEKLYNLAVKEHIVEVYAKTETIDVLERVGAIVVIKRAKEIGYEDTIKIL